MRIALTILTFFACLLSQAQGKVNIRANRLIYVTGQGYYVPPTPPPTAGPVTFQESGATHTDATTVFNLAVPATGIQAGDLLMALFYVETIDAGPDVPAGWAKYTEAAGTRGKVYVYYKISDGTESGTVSFNYGGSAQSKVGRMYRFRGNRPSGNIFEGTGEILVATQNPVNQPATPATTTNDLALWIIGITNDTAPSSGNTDDGTWSFPVARSDLQAATSQGDDSQVNLRLANGTGGVISGFSYTFSYSSDETVSFTIVIKAK